MYFKLALKNVRKSYKNYLIYFLTLAFSVCLFFTFNSFQEQQAVMQMSESQEYLMKSLSEVMLFLSIFIAVVLGFLILYANQFLIKQRKKEFGMYTLLGMQKSTMSKLLVYETLFIGLASLAIGIVLGLMLSQVLVVITANIFTIPLNYRFVFSMDSFIFTIVSFTIIFLIVMIFNIFVLRRFKLIDLLYADKKNDVLKVKNVWIYVITFILSIICLGISYRLTWMNGARSLLELGKIIPLGTIGTLLFFLSLAGFLLKFVQTSKKLYFRKLNVFVLREVNSSIKSNFISMSVVCIMLLCSIGALSTAFNMNRSIGETMDSITPYGYSYREFALTSINQVVDENGEVIEEIEDESKIYLPLNVKEDFEKWKNNGLKDIRSINVYDSGVKGNVFSEALKKEKTENADFYKKDSEYGNEAIGVVKLSEYNQLLKDIGKQPFTIKKNEVLLATSNDKFVRDLEVMAKSKASIKLYGEMKVLSSCNSENQSLSNSMGVDYDNVLIVLNDDEIEKNEKRVASIVNFNFEEGADEAGLKEKITKQLLPYRSEEDSYSFSSQLKSEIIESNRGNAVVITYIGLYLGIVFLLASAVVLALQQLSKASENKKRYDIINKLGADRKMINQSIMLQLSIYFFMPLALAIVHSIVGINFASKIAAVFGKSDLFFSTMLTAGIIVLIYGSYFLITYLGYKNIIKDEEVFMSHTYQLIIT